MSDDQPIAESLTKKRLITQLFQAGHFRNPEMPTGVSSLENAVRLSLSSEEVTTAIKSYQDFLRPDFDRLSAIHHNRAGLADGKIGPATRDLLLIPRCGEPDFPEDVQAAVGSGSWDAGCWEEYPDNHAFGIYFDKRRMPSFWQPIFDRAFQLVADAYRNMGIIFFESKDRDQCNTRVSWERGSGWIGLAIVPRDPNCRTKPIWAKFDTRYGASFATSKLLNQIAMLLAHEWGHNMGLRHSRGGVMNPSIWSARFTSTMWRGDPSEPYLKRWFGGVPIPKDGDKPAPDDPDQPPTPPDPQPPRPDRINRIAMKSDDKTIIEYNLTPIIKV